MPLSRVVLCCCLALFIAHQAWATPPDTIRAGTAPFQYHHNIIARDAPTPHRQIVTCRPHHRLVRVVHAPPETVVVVRHTSTTIMATPRPVPWIRAIAPQSFKQVLCAILIFVLLAMSFWGFRQNVMMRYQHPRPSDRLQLAYALFTIIVVIGLLLYATHNW